MLDRLNQADRISGGGAALALVATLLPWYHFDDGTSRVTANGFGAGFLGDVVFLAAAAALLAVLARVGVVDLGRDLDRRAPAVLGAVVAAAVILQLLVGVNGSGAFHHATIGIAVALVAGLAMLVGGWGDLQRVSPRALRRR